MVASLQCTSDFLRWPGYVAVFYFRDQTSRNCLVWPTYIRIPQHIVATYAYSQTCPCMEDIMFISEWVWCGIFMQLIPHLVGQLLLLLMQVWWHNLWDVIFIWEPTQLICAEMWIASRCTLNSKNFHWGHTPRPPYKHVLRMQHTRLQIFQYFAWIMYFARPKLKCFCHSWLTLLLLQQKFVHVTMRQQQTDSGGNAHIKKLM